MASKDNAPGMFARVANFVRTPAPSAGAGKAEKPDSTESSAQTIKRVLERKAHNDEVRKREFAQLRKLRHASAEEAVRLVARDSFFLDSTGFGQLEERAMTLRKIDEIEAQMSKQWWKSRQGGLASEALPETVPAIAEDSAGNATKVENMVSFAATVPADFGAASQPQSQPGEAVRSEVRAAADAAQPPRVVGKTRPARTFELTGNSAFSPSKMMTVEMGQTLSDPTLEDAAIRFANGDDVGAETVLLDGVRASAAASSSLESWAAALFDLYRGLGQQQRFDLFALDYAQRFGRTAPPWFSIPSALGRGLVGSASLPQRGPQAAAVWVCPQTVNQDAMGQLDQVLRSGSSQVLLDWRQIGAVAPELAPGLADVLHRCSEQPYVLQILGEDVLANLLRARTPVGNNRVDRSWWAARLDWLRVLGRQSDFEAASMDYCITFEESPPGWQVARCRRSVTSAQAGILGGFDVTVRNDLEVDALMELKGELKGDLGNQLNRVVRADQASACLSVDCERLIRVDFAAAGSVLNCAAVRHKSGQQT